MLLNRIVPYIEPLLRKNQNGFRQGRLNLSQMSTSSYRGVPHIKPWKAFDSVDHAKMFVGLYLNGKKTEYIIKCKDDKDFVIKSIQNTLLNMVSD